MSSVGGAVTEFCQHSGDIKYINCAKFLNLFALI